MWSRSLLDDKTRPSLPEANLSPLVTTATRNEKKTYFDNKNPVQVDILFQSLRANPYFPAAKVIIEILTCGFSLSNSKGKGEIHFFFCLGYVEP